MQGACRCAVEHPAGSQMHPGCELSVSPAFNSTVASTGYRPSDARVRPAGWNPAGTRPCSASAAGSLMEPGWTAFGRVTAATQPGDRRVGLGCPTVTRLVTRMELPIQKFQPCSSLLWCMSQAGSSQEAHFGHLPTPGPHAGNMQGTSRHRSRRVHATRKRVPCAGQCASIRACGLHPCHSRGTGVASVERCRLHVRQPVMVHAGTQVRSSSCNTARVGRATQVTVANSPTPQLANIQFTVDTCVNPQFVHSKTTVRVLSRALACCGGRAVYPR